MRFADVMTALWGMIGGLRHTSTVNSRKMFVADGKLGHDPQVIQAIVMSHFIEVSVQICCLPPLPTTSGW